jgi:hypothetical protein
MAVFVEAAIIGLLRVLLLFEVSLLDLHLAAA